MISDMSPEIEVTLQSLKVNHFDARFAQTVTEARRVMLKMIPLRARVGVGDSATLWQIGILEELKRRGTKVINPFTREMTQNPAMRKLFIQTCRRIFGSDVFITGSNAVTEDGKMVSIDYAGNRVAGMIYGAPKVILVVGRNKIVKDWDGAIYRIKNVIAPTHAKRKGQKTPCAITGQCNDCNSPDRICNVTIILEKKPAHTDLSIIIVNEDLGLGWNPSWDEKRISQIRADYCQNTWTFFASKS